MSPSRRSKPQQPHDDAAPSIRRHWAEDAAGDHLLALGWTVLDRNYAVRGGELDLIAQDGDTVVFVEVRQRRNDRFGGAAESLDYRKLQRLRNTARHYLAMRQPGSGAAVRFDAVLVTGTEGSYRLEHLRDVL